MITSKHLVIVIYIMEMCCACVGIFSITGFQSMKKQVQSACQKLAVLLLIRLIVKMVYFYVEYYIKTWPLNFAMNTAMDTTYVISILLCFSIVEEVTERHFPKQRLFLILSAIVYVAGFEVISCFWIDPVSNVDIILEKGFPRIFYYFNEIVFFTMTILHCMRYARVLGQYRKQEDGGKRKIYQGCMLILLNNFWYSLYVFLWNISFFTSWGKKFRSLKPLDGVLFFALFLILIYVYSISGICRSKAEEAKPQEEGQDSSAADWEGRLSNLSQKYKLTKREIEILGCLIHGDSYQDISEKLIISVNTVKKHCSNIYQKCGVKNRNQIFALLNTENDLQSEKFINHHKLQ